MHCDGSFQEYTIEIEMSKKLNSVHSELCETPAASISHLESECQHFVVALANVEGLRLVGYLFFKRPTPCPVRCHVVLSDESICSRICFHSISTALRFQIGFK